MVKWEDVVKMVESDSTVVYAQDVKSCGDCVHESIVCPGWAAYHRGQEEDLPCFSWRKDDVISTTGGRK